jgi:hypothetical protein
MAKAYKHLRRQRTERRLKNQSFMEPSKRPLTGKRKKSFIRSLFSKDASEHSAEGDMRALNEGQGLTQASTRLAYRP